MNNSNTGSTIKINIITNTVLKTRDIGNSGRMECFSSSGMDSIRMIGMSQTEAVRWIGVDCLMLRVNVVSKLLLMFILILYIVLLKML